MKLTKLAMATLLILALLSVVTNANPYPATLDSGNLVLVDGGMGVGKYADRSSVVVERYAPPNYQIAIHVIPVTFSEDYWREHNTYVGSPYRMGEPFLIRFRYNWDRKMIAHERRGSWQDWDINHDYSHDEGDPLIPCAAEVAFVSAYHMEFFGDKMGYSPVLKKQRRVIDDNLYRALGM